MSTAHASRQKLGLSTAWWRGPDTSPTDITNLRIRRNALIEDLRHQSGEQRAQTYREIDILVDRLRKAGAYEHVRPSVFPMCGACASVLTGDVLRSPRCTACDVQRSRSGVWTKRGPSWLGGRVRVVLDRVVAWSGDHRP